jgi:glycosyltransferase involved in cell wall biosynthesis
MSLGKPVVITKIPGNTDLVEDGKSGILVPPGDPASLAEAIMQIYNDESMKENMGKQAKDRMHTTFHIEKTIAELKAHYLFLLNESGR